MSAELWRELQELHTELVNRKISDLFKTDEDRFSKFSLQINDILFDYSKQAVNSDIIQKLCELAESAGLRKNIEKLFSGDNINHTEQRPALHTALRDPTSIPLVVNGLDIKPEIHYQLNRMGKFAEMLRVGKYLGATQKPMTDVICLGIGGSELGPSMVCRALNEFRTTSLRCHFVSNVDGRTLGSLLRELKPEQTLCVISSKTFTTAETLQNAKAVHRWFKSALGECLAQHLVAVTADPSQAAMFGVSEENIFEFWDFVGGRYSIWSVVGLPIAILLGIDQFRLFLSGAAHIDQHFRSAPFSENMPVLMGLLGIWNINFLKYATHAIIPYDDRLKLLPDYLQQLEMESNGKNAAFGSDPFISTAPIIWGGVGCNGQHAYMQLLHQGSHIVPIDFLVAAQGDPDYAEHHQLLVANCLSQSKALMEGNQSELIPDRLSEFKLCAGNRPSSTIMYSKLTPETLGALIALYEHKVFVQGVIWGINSFDQWGVELGKKWVGKILPCITGSDGASTLDSSTRGLVDFFQKNHQ
jgi:glucose-6-phosphate isomerase